MTIQCRTIPSCRPCGARDCTRPECSSARQSADVFATMLDTENGSTGSESVPQSQRASESMPSLERLTRAHVLALMDACHRDAEWNVNPSTELREAFRILCEADLDARGW